MHPHRFPPWVAQARTRFPFRARGLNKRTGAPKMESQRSTSCRTECLLQAGTCARLRTTLDAPHPRFPCLAVPSARLALSVTRDGLTDA